MAATTAAFMSDLLAGKLSDDAIVLFLTELRERGETAEDILEAARAMRASSVKVSLKDADLLDTCGTGGDGRGTVNVSTLAALVAAAAGAKVAKHGNRAVSGVSGSADLLEALGVRIEITPETAASMIEKTGFAFLFAPCFHPAMKNAGVARKKIQGRTLFNCLGPLTNPAGAQRHLLGVYDSKLLEPVAHALAQLGAVHAIVVHGNEGLDEVSLSGPTSLAEWKDDTLRMKQVKPQDYGLKTVPLEKLACRSKDETLERARKVLEGKESPDMDFVVLNAAFALRAAGLHDDIREGIRISRELLKSGKVLKKLAAIREHSQKA